MTLFKTGDRIEYVGNDTGSYMTKGNVGKIGVVTKDQKPDEDFVSVTFDSFSNPVVYAANIRKFEKNPVDPYTAVLEKYVAEFDKIVKNGTAVERYTALGFLSSFAFELAAASPEE